MLDNKIKMDFWLFLGWKLKGEIKIHNFWKISYL